MATSQLRNSPRAVTRRTMSKVPEVTAYFWIVKVLTTGMGETTSDYLAHRLGPIVAVAAAGVVLAASLALQFTVRRYVAWIYWTAIVMVSVFGTMAADVVHVVLGVPYVISTAFFVVALAAIFALWYASERTLSIHSVVTPRRELFYWTTVMTTFALGTATGDMTAVTVHLGYLASGVMFAVLIAVPAVAYGLLRMNAIAAFWVAYVLTRPLGASFADWLGVSRARGGVALGTGPVSLALAVVIVAFVGYLTVSRRDTIAGRQGAHAAGRRSA
ncbi:COG4705 family protein [Actinoallomurus soli]|uniref:COG4705 family protein n=1 Tax=Actinoallomurus soli TaxID=2952535 RepID=UPI002092E39A|nr:hypothetical protein [Actinoallomurus soli]MCO5972548.1 hypothetical protein [Actinoallomurus soli]